MGSRINNHQRASHCPKLVKYSSSTWSRRLKDLINPEKDNSIEMTSSLRELFSIAAQTLESAESECRYQQTLSPMRAIGSESLYGLDFFKIGMHDKNHTMKKCRLMHSAGTAL